MVRNPTKNAHKRYHNYWCIWFGAFKTIVELLPGEVKDAAEAEFNSNLLNLMVLNVKLHRHLIPEFDLEQLS